MTLLAIDPGSRESGWCTIDEATQRPHNFGKSPNETLRKYLRNLWIVEHIAIEQIGHYGTGMPAGRDVFDTCVWIGRFTEAAMPQEPTLVLRATIKTHLCGTPRATDANVKQALVDRFASGVRNHGKGSKAEPGWFYGFHTDIWSAYALAVYLADTLPAATPSGDAA